MVLTPIASVPAGKQANLVFLTFDVRRFIPFRDGDSFWWIGGFRAEGSLEGRMTLYDVKKSGNQIMGRGLWNSIPNILPLA